MKLEDKIKDVYMPAEFPSCDRAKLVRNFNTAYGHFITADQVERVLLELYIKNDSLARALLDVCKQLGHTND